MLAVMEKATTQLGVSPRTVRRFVAEPRKAYLSRAEQRRQQIRDLRETGLESLRSILQPQKTPITAARVKVRQPGRGNAKLSLWPTTSSSRELTNANTTAAKTGWSPTTIGNIVRESLRNT